MSFDGFKFFKCRYDGSDFDLGVHFISFMKFLFEHHGNVHFSKMIVILGYAVDNVLEFPNKNNEFFFRYKFGYRRIVFLLTLFTYLRTSEIESPILKHQHIFNLNESQSYFSKLELVFRCCDKCCRNSFF